MSMNFIRFVKTYTELFDAKMFAGELGVFSMDLQIIKKRKQSYIDTYINGKFS